MIEQGNAAKAEQGGGRGARAGAPAPGASAEKVIPPDDCHVVPGPLGRIIVRVAAALEGACSGRRRPVDPAAAATRRRFRAIPPCELHGNQDANKDQGRAAWCWGEATAPSGKPPQTPAPKKVIPKDDCSVQTNSLDRIRRESSRGWKIGRPSRALRRLAFLEPVRPWLLRATGEPARLRARGRGPMNAATARSTVRAA